MKNNHQITWICINCNKSYINTLHEIFYGSLRKKQSENYNLQVPACPECHNKFHKHKEKYQKILCKKMNFPDPQLIRCALQNNDKDFLNRLSLIGASMLNGMEV